MNAGLPDAPPPRLDWTRSASELDDAPDWLRSRPQGELAAQVFSMKLREEMTVLAARIAEGYRPLIDEAASIAYARPMHQHRFRTSKRRRARDSSGVWRVFYSLADLNNDGVPDELHVISIIHAAAPLKDSWLDKTTDDEAD